MREQNNNKNIINLGTIFKTLWMKKKVFFIMWPIVFALSCLWIFPQPRYFDCNVSLAPEVMTEDGGGLSSIASSFGINLGGGGNDAIYPMLYPDLFESNEFIVGLLNINVKTENGEVNTDYYTYLTKYKKKNWLTLPFQKVMYKIKNLFSSKKPSGPSKNKALNPFMLSEYDYGVVEKVKDYITCSVDKKTDVITITVRDQDRLVCAMLADSVSERLQNFIINYRTHKTRIDMEHYRRLADSTNLEYRSAVNEYAAFCDANNDIILQSQQSKRDELENEMQLKYNTYTAMCTQLEAAKAKLQEKTPAFTTLQSATVPIKPAGPKRMFFVLSMLIIATIITALWCLRYSIKEFFKKQTKDDKVVYKIIECEE